MVTGVLIALLSAANAATYSRTGLVALFIVLGLTWLWRRSHTHHWVWGLWAVVCYAVASFALPLLSGQSGNAWARLAQGDALCSGRMTLWRNVLDVIAVKPWLGWGWGELDYAHYITLYAGPRFCAILDNAHNLPLHMAVVWGVPVATALVALLCIWVWRLKPWREAQAARQMAWGMLAVLGFHSLLEYPLWYGPFQVVCVLCVYVLHTVRNTPSPLPLSPKGARGKNIAAAVLCVAALGVGWDYTRVSQLYLGAAQRLVVFKGHRPTQSWLFQDQIDFAHLQTTPLTRANASDQYELALQMLHFSPEALVSKRVIDSALMLRLEDVAAFHLRRYNAAFKPEQGLGSAPIFRPSSPTSVPD